MGRNRIPRLIWSLCCGNFLWSFMAGARYIWSECPKIRRGPAAAVDGGVRAMRDLPISLADGGPVLPRSFEFSTLVLVVFLLAAGGIVLARGVRSGLRASVEAGDSHWDGLPPN